MKLTYKTNYSHTLQPENDIHQDIWFPDKDGLRINPDIQTDKNIIKNAVELGILRSSIGERTFNIQAHVYNSINNKSTLKNDTNFQTN